MQMGLFQFLFKTKANPYNRLALKQSKSAETKALLAMLPSLVTGFTQGADSIYRRLLIEQFKDYEQRYGCALLHQINDEKKFALVRVVSSFMLYTFCKKIAETHPSPVALPLTCALHFEIYKEKPINGVSPVGSFMNYITYQNPNFEDRKLAPAFLFGNEVAQIMETMDMAFSFMASQQAILISEITQKILTELMSGLVQTPTVVERPA
jgi:hypothetical protein